MCIISIFQMDDYLNMNEDGIRTNKELILLWDEKTVEPQGTIEWLKGSWFSGHHHIRIHKRMVQWDLKKVEFSFKMRKLNMRVKAKYEGKKMKWQDKCCCTCCHYIW